MADKDTRDDFEEMRGEPVVPPPDVPPSEGGPATAPPDPTTQESLPTAAVEPELTAPPEPAPEPTCFAADPATETPPATGTTPSDAAQPAVAAPEAPAAEAVAPTDGTADPGAGPVWSSAIADALSTTPPAAEPPSAADGASFTDAAEGLFRPGRADPSEGTHLITLGRRLDPSLRIPKPVPPVIEPRFETERPQTRLPSEPLGKAEPARDHRIAWADANWKERLVIAGRYVAYAVGVYLALVLVLILLFRFVNPPGSMLMLSQFLTGTSIDRRWVPIDSISRNLVRAVIVSEDGRFCEHSGIDTAAIREAIERAARGTPRGASTISMQVTKNLFLWNAKSYIRKVIEIPLTLVMELAWPKQRILEVYLNIAEWGPGIFGAEAAAQHHFGKRAADLTEREAALLAAVLPNPVVRDAGSPGPQTSAKARVVQARVKAYGAVASCVTNVAAPAATPAKSPAAKAIAPLRKPAPRPPARQKTAPKSGGDTGNDWIPTLKFGPN